jgi:site-specific recombinase XerC
VIGKGDRERTVVITEKARQAIEQYLEARTDPSPALFIGFQPAKKDSAGNRLTVQGANQLGEHLGHDGQPRPHWVPSLTADPL